MLTKRCDTSNYEVERPLPIYKNKKDSYDEGWIRWCDYERIKIRSKVNS